MILLCCLFIGVYTIAQTNCKPYITIDKGSKWEITNYSKKGKAMGKIAYKLIEKEEEGNTTIFKVKAISYDEKGKEIFDSSYDAKCIDGVFTIDMAYKISEPSMQAYQNMEMDIDATTITIPSMGESVGKELDDGSLKVGIDTGSPLKINMTIDITDRKVEAKEQRTTTAGTFDCIVLSQKTSTKLLMKMEVDSKEWYAENIGLVRSETYNKKGKLIGYSELTKLE